MEAAKTGRSRAAVAVVAVAAAATTALWWNPAIPTGQMNPPKPATFEINADIRKTHDGS